VPNAHALATPTGILFSGIFQIICSLILLWFGLTPRKHYHSVGPWSDKPIPKWLERIVFIPVGLFFLGRGIYAVAANWR